MGPPRGVWGLSESGKGKGYWKTLQPLTRVQSKIGEKGSNLGDQGADQGAQRGREWQGSGHRAESRGHRAQDLQPPRSLPTPPNALQKNTSSLLLVQRKKKNPTTNQNLEWTETRRNEGQRGGAGRRKRSLNVRKHASKSPREKTKRSSHAAPSSR